MKCVTTRVYSTLRSLREGRGGDVRRRSRGSINGDKKDGKEKKRKTRKGAGCVVAWLDCD